MKRKNKLPAPIIALVLATAPLTGVAALPTAAQAATPIATAPAEGVVRQRSDYGFDKNAIGPIGDVALIMIDCEGVRK